MPGFPAQTPFTHYRHRDNNRVPRAALLPETPQSTESMSKAKGALVTLKQKVLDPPAPPQSREKHMHPGLKYEERLGMFAEE